MLINCPKCGFSQPKDQYCAKCGVDMDTYKPKQASLITRTLSHSAFHISVVFICVFVAVAYIMNSRKKSYIEQLESFPQGNQGPAVVDKLAERSSNKSPTTAANVAENHAEVTPSPAAPTTATAQTAVNMRHALNNSAETQPTTGPGFMPTSDSARAVDSKTDKRVSMKIIYAEVDEMTLKRWVPEMQASGFYSDTGWNVGMLPQIEKRMTEDRSIITLESVEKKMDPGHANADWITGKQSESNSVGFSGNMALALDDNELRSFKGNIKIQRNLDGAEPRVLETDFELPKKAGLVFWRVLNPKMPVPTDFTADTGSFFQIYRSARFKNQRSDFTIFVVLDTPSKP